MDMIGSRITQHVCVCEFPLYKVGLSNMLSCHNPICEEGPFFLVPQEGSE